MNEQPIANKTSGAAVASLVLSLLSFIVGPFGFIPGIICGHVARFNLKKDPRLGGSGLALAGLIIGYVFLAIGIIFMLVMGSALF